MAVDDSWASQHQILLIGTQQDSDDILFNVGLDPALTVNPQTVPGYDLAMNALKKLPDNVVRGLEPQYNAFTKKMVQKAIYFSTYPGRGYANDMPTGYPGTQSSAQTGFFLQPSVSWDYLALHEAGHIIDLCGTNRGGYYWQPISGWENLASEIDNIFDAKGDLITAYAKTNSHEDFAVHFAYYVWRGTTFRNKAQNNSALQRRYDFLKQYFFQGTEYEEPPPPVLFSLEGEVVDKNGFAIKDALVYSTQEIGFGTGIYSDKVFLVRTNYMGGFKIFGLADGSYVVWAEKEGYEKSQNITILVQTGFPGASIKLVLGEKTSLSTNIQWAVVGIAVICVILVMLQSKKKR
jgi:hypothetical protein